MKKKFVLGVLCVSMILAAGIGVSAEVSEIIHNGQRKV